MLVISTGTTIILHRWRTGAVFVTDLRDLKKKISVDVARRPQVRGNRKQCSLTRFRKFKIVVLLNLRASRYRTTLKSCSCTCLLSSPNFIVILLNRICQWWRNFDRQPFGRSHLHSYLATPTGGIQHPSVVYSSTFTCFFESFGHILTLLKFLLLWPCCASHISPHTS